MNNSKRPAAQQDRLPIKLILPKQGQERAVPAGGSPPKCFRDVNREYRERLVNQVSAIRKAVAPNISRTGAAPARVKLIAKALAKSHRPERVFSQESCPIIGAGQLGELFIKATPEGLDRLAATIEKNTSDRVKKELSSIETIEPITPPFRRRNIAPLDILRRSPRGKRGFVTRVRLFDFGPDERQKMLEADFQKTCKHSGISISRGGYTPSSYTYAAECKDVNEIDTLSRIVGVRSITQMPLIRTLRPKMLNARSLPSDLPQRSQIEGDFPVVVVVDSGINDKLPELEGWVVGRESSVAPQYLNTDHGTFVAGLICWGAQLNPHLDDINQSPCGVFDLQVLPNSDPNRGDTEQLTEAVFLEDLEDALKQYANQYRVWNLSLSTAQVCSLDEFSPLAEQLDNLQEKYNVSFVVAAGNYESVPLLDYPRTEAQLDLGRITSPADSVLGVTVGAISHLDYAKNGPKQNHPSAFSRHGSGPNHIIKPDLVHFGGTCSTNLSHQAGVSSIGGTGIVEDLGTSFATPLVSCSLAQIYHHITPTPSPVLARALLTHHARDPRTGGRVPDGEETFFGFGRPAPAPYCLECTPHTSTLVFEDTLRAGWYLEWDDFPYPPSLRRNGHYFGEIWMTVAFAPARGARWGSEYCEAHIDAHFGVYDDHINRKTGEVTRKFRGLVPPEHKNPGLLYESYQVEKLRKWAPVRTYHGDLGEKGERGQRWRLKVQLLTRHGIEDQDTFRPQPFSLIISIADPTKTAPVYDEMAQIVHNRFRAENLTVRAAARIRTRT
jgi:serine protease AprX